MGVVLSSLTDAQDLQAVERETEPAALGVRVYQPISLHHCVSIEDSALTTLNSVDI